jgi:hypothetical protein
VVLEGHTAMRFAWLKEQEQDDETVEQGFTHRLSLIRRLYNLAFWVFLLPFFTFIDYSTGFIAFTVIIAIRLVLNLVTNNLLNLTPGQYEGYPFRI